MRCAFSFWGSSAKNGCGLHRIFFCRKCGISPRKTQSIPAGKYLFPTQNLTLNSLAVFRGAALGLFFRHESSLRISTDFFRRKWELSLFIKRSRSSATIKKNPLWGKIWQTAFPKIPLQLPRLCSILALNRGEKWGRCPQSGRRCSHDRKIPAWDRQ